MDADPPLAQGFGGQVEHGWEWIVVSDEDAKEDITSTSNEFAVNGLLGYDLMTAIPWKHIQTSETCSRY